MLSSFGNLVEALGGHFGLCVFLIELVGMPWAQAWRRGSILHPCLTHLGHIWGPIGRSGFHFGVILVPCWCHLGAILMSFFTLGVPPGRLLGLRSLFNFFLITCGTIWGPIFG